MKRKINFSVRWLLLIAFLSLLGCVPSLRNAAINGNVKMLESLISKGQDINQLSLGGDTALILAAFNGNKNIAQLLVDKGAKLDIQNQGGETALILAAFKGNTDIAQLLIDKGAKLDIQNQYGYTALTQTIFKGNTNIAQLLVDKGAKLDIQNQYGNTNLILAAKKGNTDIAQLLVDKGAKLDIQNQGGDTALIIATAKGNAVAAQMLIDKGANLNIRDKNGRIALEIAVSHNQYTIAEMIRAEIAGGPPSSKTVPPSSSPPPATYATYTGTGWVTEGGYIVTNNHVIEGQIQVKVRFNSRGGEEYLATVALSDRHNDLAILQIDNTKMKMAKGIPIASKLPRIGAKVFTIGYPKSGVMGINPKVTDGIISSLSGIQDDPRIIQTTVSIQMGNSGGPLLSMNGEVVGVTTATLRTQVSKKGIDVPQNVNYAVKSVYVSALLSQLPINPTYPMMTILINAKLEDMIPKIQNSIVQIIVKSKK